MMHPVCIPWTVVQIYQIIDFISEILWFVAANAHFQETFVSGNDWWVGPYELVKMWQNKSVRTATIYEICW